MIFVIIPVHNRKNLTQSCLESLKQQYYRGFNVILVDDGSTDGTSEMVQLLYPDTILLKGDGNLWWAGSVNKGIRYALSVCQSDDYILTLNDDLIVPPEYLTSLREAAIKNPNCIIGSVESTMNNPKIIKSGGIHCNWMTAKENVLNFGKNLDEFPPNFKTEVSILTGRGSLYPSKIFREVGLFDDQNIIQCADTELPIRANLQFGYRLIVCYDAVVYSYIDEKENINSKEFYSLSDINEYFFDLRSHFNLKTHYWIARNISPNNVWFLRYLSFNILRTIGHFIIRLNLFRINSKKKNKIYQ
jgi:GT2 family glycosyltransferase